MINEKLKRFEIFIIKIIGIRRVISTSKIKKITAIKKNCRENGKRADDLGSNPHSKGEFFSRSEWVFLEIRVASIITIKEINRRILEIVMVIIIIYTNLLDLLIGSQK
jgi:hypothetical protein